MQSATGSPSLQATAPLGNVYLNVAALNQTTNPLVVTGSALTGQAVDLQIGDGESQAAVQTTTTPQASTYILSGVAATQQLDVDAGISTAVTVSLTGNGDLNVGTITSSQGDVSLTSTGGSIVDATGGTATNVNANTITLDAGGSIGTASDPLTIDSAYSGSGLVKATASQAITLDQAAGNLNLGVISAGGLATLTSAGAILDGDAASATALTAPGAVLAAGSGIGTATSLIQAQVQDLAADAGSGGLWINNSGSLTINDSSAVTGLSADGALSVTSGALTVDQDVAAGGDITLTASGGDVTIPAGVLVQSTGGSVTLDAGGNVTLSASSTVSAFTTVAIDGTDPAGSTIDLSGSLAATSASITTGSGDDTININQLPAGVPLTVNGGGFSSAGNTLNITGTPGPDTVGVSSSQVVTQVGASPVTINYSDIQALNLNVPANQGDNDTFNVTSTSAATTIDGGPGNDTLNLYASPNGSAVLNAPVIFAGGAGSNTVNVFGSARRIHGPGRSHRPGQRAHPERPGRRRGDRRRASAHLQEPRPQHSRHHSRPRLHPEYGGG